MEYIKKKILQATTTGTTTGCTGTCRIIIPNTGATYGINFCLIQDAQDIGFFDAYDFTGVTGTTITPTHYTVTGHSSSRLVELRKYVTGGTISQIYVTGGTYLTDGIDLVQSIGNQIVYFLGAPKAIRYVDILTGFTSGTTFSFITSGVINNPNFINKPMYKDMNKENIISNPKIANDVFIVRQELSAFDKNYRLEYINSLIDLETYAGGGFFNIVNNT